MSTGRGRGRDNISLSGGTEKGGTIYYIVLQHWCSHNGSAIRTCTTCIIMLYMYKKIHTSLTHPFCKDRSVHHHSQRGTQIQEQ